MEQENMAVARLPPIKSSTLRLPDKTQKVEQKVDQKVELEVLPRRGSKSSSDLNPASRMYKLAGTEKYQLPSPQALRPYVDTTAGSLDTWPAHASGHATSMVSVGLNRKNNLVVANEEEQGKPSLIPKPRFLEQLESFLKKELRALGVTQVQPSDLRLQAHREVFEYLIEDFKTYKPLLASIKNEYEMMLTYQREQIRMLEPLKQMLVTVSEQCDQKIMQQRELEKEEITNLKKLNQMLHKKIDEMRNEHKSLEAQVDRLLKDREEEYKLYRDECDAKKQLVSDINELRYQQEDVVMAAQQEETDKEDVEMLRIAVKKAREGEADASRRLAQMEADYGDVVPRRDFESLTKQMGEQKQSFVTLEGDFDKLRQEHDILLETHKQVIQQRDQYYQEAEHLRRSATPRPDWEKVGEHVQGGLERWLQITKDKSSDEMVDLVIQEVMGSDGGGGEGAEYFEGLGTGEEVPVYLRFDGQVRNRRLGKRDCALIIRDIWREKTAHDAEVLSSTHLLKGEVKRDTLADFLLLYLKKRFSLDSMVYEWAYNLQEAFARFANDERIGMFWRILSGDGDEEIYYEQLTIIAKLLNHLTKVDTEKGNQGSLTLDDFKQALTNYFAEASPEQIDTLVKYAETELEAIEEGALLEFQELFMEDDEGKTGPFVDEVKKMINNRKEAYIKDIRQALGDVEEISVDDLRKAFTLTDPDIDAVTLDNYLMWVFGVLKEKFGEVAPITMPKCMTKLMYGNIARIGKKSS